MKQVLLIIVKKTIRAALLLAAAAILAFALVSASPIDPLQANIGQAALGSLSAEHIAQLEEYWGVNTPPLQRLAAWAGDVCRGDLGLSLLYRQPVTSVIGQKLGNSLLLLLSAWLISGLLGLTLGVVAGACRGRWPDRLIRAYALLMAATPTFWLALVLLMVFAVWLQILPVGLSVPIGLEAAAVTLADRLRHALLPALTLSIVGVANITLHTRAKLIDVLHSDYVLFARSRGESRFSILRRHGLRNILLPAVSLQFASISEIIGGSILVEQVFSYPGLGQAAITAALGSDLPLLLGVTLITTAIVFGGNLAADLLYGLIDPRIRRGVSR